MKAFLVRLSMLMALCAASGAFEATNPIPYMNAFELADGYTNGQTVVDNTAGWYATDIANGVVVTQTLDYLGELPIPAANHDQVLGFTDTITNMVQGGLNSNVWIDCLLMPTRTDDSTPEGLVDAKTMLYFNSNGYPVVWGAYPIGGGNYSNAWHTTTTTSVDSGQWARVTIEMNLESEVFTDNEYFKIYIDNQEINFPNGMTTAGTETSNGPWLKTVEDVGGNNQLNSITLKGVGKIDDLQVILAQPITVTTYAITSIVDNVAAATITPPASGSGGKVTISASNDIPFTITALGGYAVTNVYVDYTWYTGWVGATNAYTMTNILSDGYIKVFTKVIGLTQTSNGTPYSYYDAIFNTSSWTDDTYEDYDSGVLDDGDGVPGFDENLAGTDANDSNSYFRVLNITYGGSSNEVYFFGTTNYGGPSAWSMYRSVDLGVSSWDLISTNGIIPAISDPESDGTNYWVDLYAPGTTPVFYRPSAHHE